MPKLAWTYDSLKGALQDWMEDSFADFVGELDVIIGLAERRCYRDLDLVIHDKRDVAISTAAATPTMAKPADCITIVSLYVNGTFLKPRSREYIEMITADAAANAAPVYYAEEDETTIRLAPTPDTIYPSIFVYNGTPDGLSGSNTSTWLGDNFPDLLFAACLVKSEDFVDEEENRGRYDAEYGGLLIKAKEESKHLRRPDFIRAGKIPQPLPRPLP